ncbi:MAG: hypothetical protein ACHQ6U_09575 [Thermodesulfobacteriota bacterium]
MDFNKRNNDEILTARGKIEAVSVRTSSLNIKGEWYRLTDMTEGAKKIDLIRAAWPWILLTKYFADRYRIQLYSVDWPYPHP